jgi:hypothetical protein
MHACSSKAATTSSTAGSGRAPRNHGRSLASGSATSWPAGSTTTSSTRGSRPARWNVGYFLFAPARGKGYATRAAELLLEHLRRETVYTTATLVIHPENKPSLGVALRAGFTRSGSIDGDLFFTREL